MPSLEAAENEWSRATTEGQRAWVSACWTVLGWLFLSGLACGLVYALVAGIRAALSGEPLATACFLAAGVSAALGYRSGRRWQKDRENDTIDGFARSFNLREVDPWVVRAVWEAAEERGLSPIRKSDLLSSAFDEEEHNEIFTMIVLRSMRRVEDVREHSGDRFPSTVEGLVLLFSSLPRTDRTKSH